MHTATSSASASFITRLQKRTQRKTIRRRIVRASLVVINVGLLVSVLYFVLSARNGSANPSQPVASSAANSAAVAPANPLDQLSSADIAVTVSRMTGLSESTAVTNQADSEDVALTSAPVTDNVVTKPQVTSTAFKSRNDIQDYVAQAGDTITSIAAKFSVTSDSIRWSNGLTGDTVAADTKLAIPPIGYSGIVYTVKAGDTLDSLATKYKADKTELTAANDAEIGGLQVGERIIIPNGQQPIVVSTYTSSYTWGGGAASYGANGYDYGYCTWYVANKRIGIGKPLPANLGNASTWGYLARSYGLATGNTPQVGAAVVTSTRGDGHVAYVEVVNSDGSIWISEMNSYGQVSMTNSAGTGGYRQVDYKPISAGEAADYTYIY